MSENYLKFESEELLLTMIKGGSYEAFDELYNRYWSTLYGMAYNILRDHDNCKDIVQDIFVWFWEHRNQWNLSSCKGYLLTAVRFKTANFIRSNKARQEFYSKISLSSMEALDESVLLEVKQMESLIHEMIATLPVRCRQIFSLSRLDHLTNREIADKMNISEKTVEGHITHAIKRLRLNLGKNNIILFFII